MNLSIRELAQIQLKPGESVVSATYYHDYIIVVTDNGTIYKIILER